MGLTVSSAGDLTSMQLDRDIEGDLGVEGTSVFESKCFVGAETSCSRSCASSEFDNVRHAVK